MAGTLFVFFLGACAQCMCCLLIAGCGFFAAYLHSKDCRKADFPFTEGNGATVGLMGGLVYGAFSGVFGSLAVSIAGTGDWREAIDLMRDAGYAPDPVTAEQLIQFLEGSGDLLLVLVLIFASLLFGAIFGALGGLIGGSVFKVEVQPVAGYDQTPPPPPPVG
ncbi:MAG: hypothetical protein V2I26_11985 [Halieaceae bacterium]|nr:hypothetical protein [Halieaceae bacterium]